MFTIRAFKEFVVPKLDYVLRSTLAHKKWGKNLDKFVRKTVKQSLGLPGQRVTQSSTSPLPREGLVCVVSSMRLET